MRHLKRNGGLFFALGVLLIGAFLPATWLEYAYSRALFQAFRRLFDWLFAFAPFPAIYAVLPAMIIGLFFYLLRRDRSWKTVVRRFFVAVVTIIFTFQLFWGWNYQRVPFAQQIRLSPERIDSTQIWAALQERTDHLEELRQQLTHDTTALAFHFDFEPLVTELRTTQEAYFREIHFPASAKFRIRQLSPGLALRIGAAGFYFPYTGEGHVDGGLHPLQLPFVTAHEMAHGYGIGDEGVCNFIAYITTTRHQDLRVRYCGQLAFWRYLASEVRLRDGPAYTEWRKSLPLGIANDLAAIYAQMDRFPELFPRFRESAYNAYLNAQGIPEGINSYHQIVAWVLTHEGLD